MTKSASSDAAALQFHAPGFDFHRRVSEMKDHAMLFMQRANEIAHLRAENRAPAAAVSGATT